MPQLDTLVVPIGGGGLISGMAVAAKSLKPELQIIGVQAQLYPSMYNAIKGESLPMRGDTLAEGIAVKAPGRITTESSAISSTTLFSSPRIRSSVRWRC